MWGEPSLHDFISSFMWVFAPVICVFFKLLCKLKGIILRINRNVFFFNHFTAKKPPRLHALWSVLYLLPNSTLQKSSDNRPQKPFNTFRRLRLFCLLHQNPLTVNTVSIKSYTTSIRHHHPCLHCIRKLDIQDVS